MADPFISSPPLPPSPPMRWINHAAFAALLAASLLSLALSPPSSLTTVEVGGEFQLPVPSSRLAVSAFSALLSLALLVEGLPRYRRSAFIARVEGQVPEMVKSFQSAFSTGGLTMADAARMVAESGLSPPSTAYSGRPSPITG